MNTEIKITANTQDVRKKLDDLKKTIGSVSSEAQKATTLLGSMMKAVTKITTLTAKGGGIIGVGGIVAGENSFRKFEHRMMEAFTLLPKANKQAFAQMKKDALEFSETYGVSTEEVAQGMYQSLSAGINPADLKGFMSVAQESAIAGVTDLRTSVDALTNIMNAYGQETYDVQYLADTLFKGITMSKLTFEELSRYMYQAIPTAAALKLNIVDLVGAISALSATGTLTRVGATQFRQFLVELQDHGSQANTIFRRMNNGVSFQKFIAEGGRLIDVVDSLRRGARAVGLDMANLFSSIEAGNAARQMDNFERFAGMLEEAEFNAEGSQGLAYGKMVGTLQKSFDRLKATFFNFFTRIGDILEPAYKDFYRFTDELSRSLREDIDWQGMSEAFERQWKIVKNIAREGADALKEYVINAIKLGLTKALKGAVELMYQIGSALAKFFSLDGNDIRNVLKAFGDVAQSFGMKILDGIRNAMPQIINAFTPLVAHLMTMGERLLEKANPFSEGHDVNRVQKAKVDQMVDEDDPLSRYRLLQQAQGQETKEGITKFVESKRNVLDRDNNDDFVNEKKGSHFTKDFIDLGMTEGLKLEYKPLMDAARMLKKQLDSSLFNRSNKASALEAVEEDMGIEAPDIDELFDLEALGQKGEFTAKQLQKLRERIESALDYVAKAKLPEIGILGMPQNAPAELRQQLVKNLFENKLHELLKTLEYFEDQAIAMVYDAKVGNKQLPEIDMDKVRYGEIYEENKALLQSFSGDMEVVNQLEAKNRERARKAQIEASLKKLQDEIDHAVSKMGTFEVSDIPENHPVMVDLNNKINARSKMMEEYHRLYSKGIQIEDPKKADFGVSDIPKSETQPPYEIKPLFREVVADSKTRIGAGGGAFQFSMIQDRLLNQQKQLTDATQELTKAITKNLPFGIPAPEEGGDVNIKGIAPLKPLYDDSSSTLPTIPTQEDLERNIEENINTFENKESKEKDSKEEDYKTKSKKTAEESDKVFNFERSSKDDKSIEKEKFSKDSLTKDKETQAKNITEAISKKTKEVTNKDIVEKQSNKVDSTQNNKKSSKSIWDMIVDSAVNVLSKEEESYDNTKTLQQNAIDRQIKILQSDMSNKKQLEKAESRLQSFAKEDISSFTKVLTNKDATQNEKTEAINSIKNKTEYSNLLKEAESKKSNITKQATEAKTNTEQSSSENKKVGITKQISEKAKSIFNFAKKSDNEVTETSSTDINQSSANSNMVSNDIFNKDSAIRTNNVQAKEDSVKTESANSISKVNSKEIVAKQNTEQSKIDSNITEKVNASSATSFKVDSININSAQMSVSAEKINIEKDIQAIEKSQSTTEKKTTEQEDITNKATTDLQDKTKTNEVNNKSKSIAEFFTKQDNDNVDKSESTKKEIADSQKEAVNKLTNIDTQITSKSGEESQTNTSKEESQKQTSVADFFSKSANTENKEQDVKKIIAESTIKLNERGDVSDIQSNIIDTKESDTTNKQTESNNRVFNTQSVTKKLQDSINNSSIKDLKNTVEKSQSSVIKSNRVFNTKDNAENNQVNSKSFTQESLTSSNLSSMMNIKTPNLATQSSQLTAQDFESVIASMNRAGFAIQRASENMKTSSDKGAEVDTLYPLNLT